MPDNLYSEKSYIERLKEDFKNKGIYKIYLWIKKWLKKQNLI